MFADSSTLVVVGVVVVLVVLGAFSFLLSRIGRFESRMHKRFDAVPPPPDYALRRLADEAAVNHVIQLDHPLSGAVLDRGAATPKNAVIEGIFSKHLASYEKRLRSFIEHAPKLHKVDLKEGADATAPFYLNESFLGVDALALYGFLAELNPERFYEVGFGLSTRFARKAISDNDLRTKITVIDPCATADTERIADRVIKQPFSDVDPALLEELTDRDILFVDGTHRSFQGSDVTAVFLDILPRLSAGVHVHLHDIFLPEDYPLAWRDRLYNEQYLLAAFLLGGHEGYDILFPSHFIAHHPTLSPHIEALWRGFPNADTLEAQRKLVAGQSFWMRRAGRK